MSDNFTFVSNGVLSTYVYGNQGSFNQVANVAVADEVYNLNVSINTTSVSISNPDNSISITCPNTVQQSIGTYWLNSNGAWSIITPASLGVPTIAQLQANLASLSSSTSANISSANAVTANLASYTAANNGLFANSSGTFVVANNGVSVSSSGVSVVGNSGITVGPGGVYVNAQYGLYAVPSGLYVKANTGLTATTDGLFVNSAYLTSYIANSTSNNSVNLNGIIGSAYQLNSTLAANVATMTANSATYVNGTAASNFITASQISAAYLPLAGGTLTGPLVFYETAGAASNQFWLGRGGVTGSGTFAMYAPSGFGLEFGIANSAKMWMDTNGVMYINNQLQTPKIYDYDNTGYYIDPASTSNFNAITAATLYTTNYLYMVNGINGGVNTTGGPLLYSDNTNWVLKSGGGNGSWLIQNYAGTNVSSFNASGQMYFKIYYDNDNTGYYCDPASTSRLGTMWADQIRSQDNWYLDSQGNQRLLTPYNDHNYYRSWNYHVFRNSAGTDVHYIAGDGNVWMGTYKDWLSSQIRSNIFYSHNNSGYYTNPQSQSRMSSCNWDVNVWNYSSDGWRRIYYANGDRTIYEGGTTGQWVHEFRTQDDAARWLMAYSGNFYAGADIISAWSDRRMKKNIEKITDWRTILENINGYRFQWNDIGKKIMSTDKDEIEIGLIAQEVKSVLPQGTAINMLQYKDVGIPKDGIDYDPENPYLSVKEEKLIPILVEAVKAQMSKIDELEEKIKNLEALI